MKTPNINTITIAQEKIDVANEGKKRYYCISIPFGKEEKRRQFIKHIDKTGMFARWEINTFNLKPKEYLEFMSHLKDLGVLNDLECEP